MGAVWHFVLSGIIAFACTAAAFVVVNIALYVSARGNPRGIWTVYSIRKALLGIPAGTVLECRDRRVSAILYDRAQDAESTHLLYTAPLLSPLAWAGGPRSAGSLRGRANTTLAITVGSLLLVYLPLLAAGIYLAVKVSWLWWFAVLTLLGAEVVVMLTRKLFYIKWNGVAGIIPVVFLHRYDVFSLPVTYMISFGLVTAGMALALLMEFSSAFKD